MVRFPRRVRERTARPFYGWAIAGTLAVTETASYGVLVYAFAVFLTPMQADLGWTVAQLTGAYSLALLVAGLAAPLAGRWLDRRGPRALMTAGSTLGAAMVLAWSRVEGLVAFYLIWGGIGLAMAATLYEPAFATLTRWFVRDRPRAFLLLTVVAGFASTIFLPLANALVESFGWRGALAALAALLAVLTVPAHALVLRRRPEDLGLLPDGAAPGERADGAGSPDADGATPAAALRDPAFWWMTAAFFAGTLATVAVGIALIPFLLARGGDPAFAAAATGAIGAAQVLARVVLTAFGGRFRQATLAAGVLALQAGALALLVLGRGAAVVAIAVLLLGAGRGAVTLLRPAMLAERYGRAHFGAIAGSMAFALVGAQAVAPIGTGLAVARFGGYEPVLWGLAAATGLGALAMLGAGRAKRNAVESTKMAPGAARE